MAKGRKIVKELYEKMGPDDIKRINSEKVKEAADAAKVMASRGDDYATAGLKDVNLNNLGHKDHTAANAAAQSKAELNRAERIATRQKNKKLRAKEEKKAKREAKKNGTGASTEEQVESLKSVAGDDPYTKFMNKSHGSDYNHDAILKKFGGDAAKADKHFQKILGKDYAETYKGKDAIQGALTGKLNTRIGEKRVMDNMAYHKVPQAAAAIGTTAWLVSRMSDSKGQMSNSQLYGQAPQ